MQTSPPYPDISSTSPVSVPIVYAQSIQSPRNPVNSTMPPPNPSIQAFFPPTPATSPTKPIAHPTPPPIGDGFTPHELQAALESTAPKTWHPSTKYTERAIRDLFPGPQAVTFMGRVANVFDVANAPKTPRSAKGCVKLCVKDEGSLVTVRVWWASRYPRVSLGALVSVWCNHVSNGEAANLSSFSAPLFTSLFPERDRSCYLMVHEGSDDGTMFKTPLGYREGRPLSGLMTLQNFADGGYDVVGARILVVVKSIGQRKKIERKDGTATENMTIQVHDDTAEATLGLWGTTCLSPLGYTKDPSTITDNNTDPPTTTNPWIPGHTVILLQSPGWKIGRTTYLSLTSTTILDIDPAIKDADWLRKWALRQRNRESVNLPFPKGVFDLDALVNGPLRCLYTIAELDEFARAALRETFQGFLSVIVLEVRLVESRQRGMLCCGECCGVPIYGNAVVGKCKGCDGEVGLRLNPKILGQIIDETAAIAPGKFLFSNKAWQDLLGRSTADLLEMSHEELKYLSDRLLFCRLTLLFGWTGDETKAGGRICVMGVKTG